MARAMPLTTEPDTLAEVHTTSVRSESQLRLTWRKFRRHRLALIGTGIIAFFYLIVAFAGFIAYADPNVSEADRSLLPPQRIRFFDDGSFRPHVYALTGSRDPITFKRVYVADPNQKLPLTFFARGFEYKLFGLISTNVHLIGVEGANAEETLFILGTDLQGRDLFSRIIFATQVSMLIGLVGVALSLILGVVLGAVSGYYGGFVDTVIQRVIEVLRSIPTIPLWMGLAAGLPRDWSVLKIYFAITIIISLLGWTTLARVVRGRFLSLRRDEFVMAAKVLGCRQPRIIFRHMMPALISHVIAVTTLALPAMIISETSLSFLGLGLRPPAISWGVMLQQAQNVQAIALTPWLLIPAIPVIVIVLAFNFMGDGLRDAADPYSKLGR